MAARLGEFELIARFFAPLTNTAGLGLRDDVALFDVSPGCQLVVTADTVVAGVHFRFDGPPDLVARKALRVNLSDLAAKGARPIGFLQALTLNDSIDDAWLERYAAGLAEDVAAFGVPLAGGDTTAGAGPLTITITALGEVPHGNAILRSGARAGDVVYVSGTIGDSALGLVYLDGKLQVPREDATALADRYHVPQPRLALGQALRGIASAALDVSDGLVADLGHMASASGVGIVIDRDAVPLSAAARRAVEAQPALWETILTGGDDYEIAFAAPEIQSATIARMTAAPVTAIGRVTAGDARVTVTADGKPFALRATGYRHR
jgi:thiamine-monophosphate kinase